MRRAPYRRATEAETSAYPFGTTADGGPPLYPLCGYVTVDGHQCPVEYLGRHWAKDDPQYEVIAPKGFHFKREALHSMLGVSLSDVRERVADERLEKCTPDDSRAECTLAGSPETWS